MKSSFIRNCWLYVFFKNSSKFSKSPLPLLNMLNLPCKGTPHENLYCNFYSNQFHDNNSKVELCPSYISDCVINDTEFSSHLCQN